MHKYIFKRLLALIPVLFIVSAVLSLFVYGSLSKQYKK